MRFIARRSLLLSFVVFPMLPLPALAMPAITCHCFTDRFYDPARPALADPYFLATTQNSFFAASFGVEKKSIVIKKQQGVSADHLWIAYWLATRSGVDPDALLREQKTKGSWRQVATSLAIPARSLGVRFAEALKVNAADERLAGAVVDELLLRYRLHGEKELKALRQAGAGNQELVMSGLLAARTRKPAIQLYREVKGGGTSWGGLLQQARLDPADIQSEVAALVRRSGSSVSR